MSIEDVQLYQDRGLLPGAKRIPGLSGNVGYRKEHVDRLRFIARGLVYGFSLDAIAQILDTSSLMTCQDIYRIADQELGRLRTLLGPTAPSVSVLKELMDACSRTGGRQDCRIYRTLAEG